MSTTYRAKLPEYCHLRLYNWMYVYIHLLDWWRHKLADIKLYWKNITNWNTNSLLFSLYSKEISVYRINCSVKPFVPNALFLYRLKISEYVTVSWCFQGLGKGCIKNKWINPTSTHCKSQRFSLYLTVVNISCYRF